jgi:hypothetical protein
MKGWLSSDASTDSDKTANKNLPVSTVAGNKFVLASAQAKALGLISGKNTAYDGYIGFGNGSKYDYNRSDGISAGYFDFVGLAMHEIDHVLGHFSGIGDGYATAFDLFRCSNGGPSFATTGPPAPAPRMSRAPFSSPASSTRSPPRTSPPST